MHKSDIAGRAFGSHPKGRGFDSLRVHKTPYRVERYGVSFCRSLQNRASFVLTAQSDVCRTFRHNVHSFTRSFVKNDDSPIRSTQPPNGCLFKVRFPPTRSTHRERMTLKFFKLLQRNIEDDLNPRSSTNERSSDGSVMAAILAALKCLKRWPTYSMYL